MTDAQILKRMQSGDQDALEQMISRYRGYVYTVILNMLNQSGTADAEELITDTFLSVWNHAENIQPGKLKAYIGVTARNKAKDYLRASRPLPMDIDEIDIPDSGEALDEAIIREERARLVRRAIRKMKPKDREIFLRYYYYLQSTEQISEIMGIPPGTVRSRMSRGREILRRMLSKEDLS